MKTVVLESLGCKLNQAELEILTEQFIAAGFRIGNDISKADIYLLNSCTVTHIADRKTRHLIRLARRNNPDIFIVVTGCYVQRSPGEIRSMPEVDCVIGNKEKDHLVEILLSGVDGKRNADMISSRISLPEGEIPVYENSTENKGYLYRTRSQIKIQEGCRRSCSFCIIPYVRGRGCSIPEQQILNNINNRIAAGYKEVTLTGTRIGDYSRSYQQSVSGSQLVSGNNGKEQDAGNSLVNLVQNILSNTGIERLRLSSLEPEDITPDMVDLFRDSRLCRHIHISLQSGSDTVLRRMKRAYTTTKYAEAVHYAYGAIPELAITTDIIVGFPGETDDEFKESYDFCCKMSFARVHVFPYSQRPGTAAAKMAEQVSAIVKRDRMQQMLKLAQKTARHFQEQYIGKTLWVLWEQEEHGLWSGLTDNYIRVFVYSNKNLINQLLPVELLSIREQGILGKLC